jgi:hypothetical protein
MRSESMDLARRPHGRANAARHRPTDWAHNLGEPAAADDQEPLIVDIVTPLLARGTSDLNSLSVVANLESLAASMAITAERGKPRTTAARTPSSIRTGILGE